jgi:hypothetical protein
MNKKTQDLQKRFEEAIDLVIEEARQQGLSVYQWLEKHYREWNDEVIIEGLYEDFLNMKVNNVPSEISGKIPQTFEEYLNDSLKAIEYRLRALEFNKKYKTSGFEPLKKMGIIEEIKGLPKGFGEPLSSEDIEFFEMILKKTKETIENYLKSK